MYAGSIANTPLWGLAGASHFPYMINPRIAPIKGCILTALTVGF
jgi:hypothetical protein